MRKLAHPLLLACLVVLVLGTSAPAADTAQEAVTALEHALRGDDETAKHDATKDIGRLSGHLDRRGQLEVAKLLRKALHGDASSEDRRWMIRALARMSHRHAWIPVILASQKERDPVVKTQARQEILSGGSDELEEIGRILRTETSAAFRAELLLILRDRRRPDAVPLGTILGIFTFVVLGRQSVAETYQDDRRSYD